MNKMSLKKRIHAYDFAILELGLFLDTHPNNTEALRKRQELQRKRKELVAEYESRFGPYIVKSTQVKGNRWTWVDNPWPWEYKDEEAQK